MQTSKTLAKSHILGLTKGQQRLAEVHSRLNENLDAWTTLTQALALLQSPQAIELAKVGHPFTTNRLVELRLTYVALVQQMITASVFSPLFIHGLLYVQHVSSLRCCGMRGMTACH